jgi:hypothetical protein
MRNMLGMKVVAVLAAIAAVPGVVLAQTAPTTPTTATALAQSVNLSDAQSAGLVIVGLLVACGVVLWGARLVLSKFKPKV